MCMATKTISIMEDVYKLLVRNKMKGESFSDELRRVFSKKKKITEFAGAWEMTEKEAEEMKKNIAKAEKDMFKGVLRRAKNVWSV